MGETGQPGPPSRTAPPEERVRAMFDDIVERYDLLNSLLSFGMDRRWRHAAARALGPGTGDPVLDLGCGTGALTRVLPRGSPIVGVDSSAGMLSAAARRVVTSRARLVRGSAFRLPFADAAFRGAASAFVLRNLDDLPAAFAELARVVAPGGRVALVDMTGPRSRLLRAPFDAYFGAVAPFLGGLVGKREAYRYLVGSLSQLPPIDEIVQALGRAGFEGTAARPLSGGIVTLFTGRRSGRPNEQVTE